jgi:sec-independent protein translocase protein TatA
MNLGFGELVVILLIVLLLFGAGRLPRLMGDVGKGMRALREGLKEEDKPKAPPSNDPRTDA